MTVLLALSTLFFASWVVILKIKCHHKERKLVAICDSLLLFARHNCEHVHEFVQSLKVHLND